MDKGCDNDLFDLFNYKCFETIPSSCTIFNRSQYITYFIICHWDEVKFVDIVTYRLCNQGAFY